MKLNSLVIGFSIFATGSLQLMSGQAMAHGWSEFPAARQQVCYEQGGLWSGTPPNAACAEAKAISGSYPWVQRNEFSINIPDYNNQATVRAAVPDGTICYANDSQKQGFGIGRSDWTRTELSTGTFEYVFNATAPHNPSFWEFYLTTEDADLNQPLAWSDLELIHTEGNVPVVSGKYRMDVTIPADREGEAVLFVRWQRIDAVGEGFYNCSDISIVNGGGENPEPPEEPEEPTGPYLVQGTQFIPSDIALDSVNIGDTVNFAVFNKNGEQHSSFSVEINADNLNDWDRLLAAEVNGYYESFFNGNVFIGRWHAEMNHYMYFRNDLYGNYFNSRDSRASGVFSITPADQVSDVSISIDAKILSDLIMDEVAYGQSVILSPMIEGAEVSEAIWEQTDGEAITLMVNEHNELVIDTSLLSSQNENLAFRLSLPDLSVQAQFSFRVVGDTATGDAPAWDINAVYTQGDRVMHNGALWTAQWWTRGEEPGTTGEWGVWR
ncbi:lytic polysaccharide monooxygenase [Ningiella sp. W23]|uniref:lytic polysaccharide monooxygenase n=1 Tax=Ningiella sp. W23 TaxID=3023715 RepID=UPI003756496A